MTLITLNYDMSATSHTKSKMNFRNFANNFLQKFLTLSQFSIHLKLILFFRICFFILFFGSSTATWFNSYNSLRFRIIDKVNSKFYLKIHNNWRKPNLNEEQNDLAPTLPLFLLFFSVFHFSKSFSFIYYFYDL